MITITIQNESVKSFFDNLAESNEMWVSFPAGNETPWRADMVGSRKATTELAKCILQITKEAKSTTQPFGKAPSTQPFGNAPATQPTQPTPAPAVKKPGDRDA